MPITMRRFGEVGGLESVFGGRFTFILINMIVISLLYQLNKQSDSSRTTLTICVINQERCCAANLGFIIATRKITAHLAR